jgi:hypothetical protein
MQAGINDFRTFSTSGSYSGVASCVQAHHWSMAGGRIPCAITSYQNINKLQRDALSIFPLCGIIRIDHPDHIRPYHQDQQATKARIQYIASLRYHTNGSSRRLQHFVFHSFAPASAGKSSWRLRWSCSYEVELRDSTITEIICSEARDKARRLASLTSLHSR